MRLGDHGVTQYGPQDYYIERVIVHERYEKSGRGPSYDIAIVRLSDFIPFSSKQTVRNIWIPFIIIFKINFRRYSTDLLADRTASSIAGHVRHFPLRCRLGFYFLLWVIFCYNCSIYLCSNLNWHCTDEPASSVLMEVQLPVVSQSKCTQAYRSYSHVRIDQSVLCAGLEAGGKDACRVSLCDKLIGKFTILPSFRVIRVVR